MIEEQEVPIESIQVESVAEGFSYDQLLDYAHAAFVYVSMWEERDLQLYPKAIRSKLKTIERKSLEMVNKIINVAHAVLLEKEETDEDDE